MTDLTSEREAEFYCELHHERRTWKCARKEMQAEIDRLRAELRVREESQIPVIPRGAQAEIDRLRDSETATAAAISMARFAALSMARGEIYRLRGEVERLTRQSASQSASSRAFCRATRPGDA